MKPILFEVFGLTITSYAAFVALGFLSALLTLIGLMSHNSLKKEGVYRLQVLDLFVVILVSALFGSKLGHVLFEAPGHIGRNGERIVSVAQLLADDPWHWLRLTDPGYVWYGGMIAGLLTAVVYFRRRPQLPAWLYADVFAPAVMVGAAVGRLGCFLAGCCYGIPTESLVGVWFPGLNKPVHPTQLYDAAIAFSLASCMICRFHWRRFDGENLALLLIFYPFFRFFTEFFRGDVERGMWGPLSTSQWISIPLFFIGIVIYVIKDKSGNLPFAPDLNA
ncbi:MAG: prolipoprotein diacylglyceryl transferase [Myxococcales bacterium]|nr:prolipoprotein diacylglyceryl transferase [Myxococcales bacterium]